MKNQTSWRGSLIVTIGVVGLMDLAAVAPVAAQPRPNAAPTHFEGLYVAARGGSQNVFGGAFINDIDVLTQATRRVVEIAAGYRFQVFGDHMVVGAEVNYGFTDGDLMHFDPPSMSTVSYSNSTQTAWGLTVGYVGGPQNRVAVFVYGLAADRHFAIDIAHATGLFTQQDGQSFLQYGLGVEAGLIGRWHGGVAGGWQVTDYGDLVTNIDLKRTLDLRVTVLYQL